MAVITWGWHNWVFHDKENLTHFCQIIWRIWSYTEQNKFHQKLPPVGFELTISRSSVFCSANWAREESVGDFWSELSFVSYTTSHVGLCLFLESIEHEFIKALMIHRQPNTDSAQLAEQKTYDLEVLSSNPTGGNFWQNLFRSV